MTYDKLKDAKRWKDDPNVDSDVICISIPLPFAPPPVLEIVTTARQGGDTTHRLQNVS